MTGMDPDGQVVGRALTDAVPMAAPQTSRLEILDRISCELEAGTTWSWAERSNSTGWVTSGRSRMTESQAISWEWAAFSGVRG